MSLQGRRLRRVTRPVRRHPYTERGLRRLRCIRCGDQAATQWQVCADGNQYRPLCIGCDVDLNELVLTWAGLPFDRARYLHQLEPSP